MIKGIQDLYIMDKNKRVLESYIHGGTIRAIIFDTIQITVFYEDECFNDKVTYIHYEDLEGCKIVID